MSHEIATFVAFPLCIYKDSLFGLFFFLTS
nr:MAG TPA: hypothetical protein [Caudoviricetes sp.]